MTCKSRGYRIFQGINCLIMAIIVMLCFFPFLYMLAISLSSSREVVAGNVFLIPKGFVLDAYRMVLSYPNFFTAYGNTIFYTVAGGTIALCLTVMYAYPLSKADLKGTKFLSKTVVFTMFFTGGLIPNFLIVNALGLADTVWAMLLPFAIGPFNVIILINFFRSIPAEIEEAAIIDGMGYARILMRIVVPLSKPALATVALYIAVFFWNDWFYGMIYMNSQARFPVMLILRNIVMGSTFSGVSAGASGEGADIVYSTLKAATSILTMVPIILLYPFLQRYFITGLTVGSVKG